MISAESKDHFKEWSPMYVLLTVILGGGTVASITDNFPVTAGEFRTWTVAHIAVPHIGVNDTIKALQSDIDLIRESQLRTALSGVYRDKCVASGVALEYINQEIERLEREFKTLTGLDYNPPPCLDE